MAVKDTWTVWLSSGEYKVDGDNIGDALYHCMEEHPDDFIFAITCDAMQPGLVLDPKGI